MDIFNDFLGEITDLKNIAGLITNPVGTITNIGMSAVAKAAGLSSATPAESVKSHLSALSPVDRRAVFERANEDKDLLDALNEAGRQDVETTALLTADTADARDTHSNNKMSQKVQILLILLVFGTLLSVCLILGFGVAKEAAPILNVIVGILGTCAVGICNYFFGSSKGSSDKTQAMLTMKGKGNV